MVAVSTSPDLATELERLAVSLESLDLTATRLAGLTTEARRDRAAGIIRGYLLPRLVEPKAPLTVVLAGPTGSGKSTLLNSLAGTEISETGPLRPTTRGPVVLTSPETRDHFETIGGVHCRVVAGKAPVLKRLALVDTPDIDSTVSGHRRMAELAIDHADVVVFVVSALRYADEVPWEVLRRAVSRGTPILHVLNRMSRGAAGAVIDYRARLVDAGLDSTVLRISEHRIRPGRHFLPPAAVTELARQLIALAEERDRHHAEAFQRAVEATAATVEEIIVEAGYARAWAHEVVTNLRSELAEAAKELDLEGIIEVPAPEGSARQSRRWRLLVRTMEHSRFTSLRRRIRGRLISRIEADLRVAVLRSGDVALAVAGSESSVITSDLRRLVVEAVDGWFHYVDRMTQHMPRRQRDLAAAVLTAASLGSDVDGDRPLLGEGRLELVRRARRELEGRLQVVYGHLGERLVELFGTSLVPPDVEDLAVTLEAMVARSHFADA